VSTRLIGIIGGTGPEGIGLATRWAAAGVPVAIGSRSEERAADAARDISNKVSSADVQSGTNSEVVSGCKTLVVAVSYSGLTSISELRALLEGKLVVSVVSPIRFGPDGPQPSRPPAGSAAQELEALISPARLTSAFHTLSAEKLADLSRELDEDSLVFGDEKSDRDETMDLARTLGVRPLSGGKLANAYYAEQMVGLLATLNRIHKAQSGVRFVDVRKKS
jgi:NADPH-dependent F420 reductase